MTPVEIEKTNLEVHVELEAMRRQTNTDDHVELRAKIQDLKTRFDDLKEFNDDRMREIEQKVTDLKESNDNRLREIEQKFNDKLHELEQVIAEVTDNRNNQLIKWGTAIIVSLISALGLLFLRVIVPVFLKNGQ